ncbi:uncharacterized protein LOC118151400 [Callithrix jacchus]
MVSGGSGATGTGVTAGSGTAGWTPGPLRLRAPGCGGWGSGNRGRAGTRGTFLPSSASRPELVTRRGAPSPDSAAAPKDSLGEPRLPRRDVRGSGLGWEHLLEFTE